LKSLIAYSSVAHISMFICRIVTLSYWGVCGSFALIVAHGLCSSGLCLGAADLLLGLRTKFK
jgi:NADH-ubiquinone oxidoreductase chain 4